MASEHRLQPHYINEADFDVSDGWRKARFQDLATPVPVGKKWDNKSVSAIGKVPVVDQSQNGVIGFHSEDAGVNCSPSDPVFTFANHTCAMRWMEDPFSCIQNVFAFRALEGVDLRYLYYAAKGRVVLEEYKGHAPAFRSMWLPVPGYGDQGAIGEILLTIDRRVDNLRQTSTTLEAIAQALFKSWFVDFDPVRAKAEGREPEGMDATTAALFPAEFDSDNALPCGWAWVKLGDVFDVGIGKTPPRKEAQWFSQSVEDVPWVSIRDMGEAGVFLMNTAEKLTTEAVARFNVRCVPAGTVMMSFKLTVGRVAISDGILTTNEAIAHFKSMPESLPQSYLYCYLKSYDMNSIASTSSIATATNSKAIRGLAITHPGDPLALAFNDAVAPLFERIRMQQKQANTLSEIRDTILPRLISGKLRLPDVEREVEAVTA